MPQEIQNLSALKPVSSEQQTTIENYSIFNSSTSESENRERYLINGVPVTSTEGGPIPEGSKLIESTTREKAPETSTSSYSKEVSETYTQIPEETSRVESVTTGYVYNNPYSFINTDGQVELNDAGKEKAIEIYNSSLRELVKNGLSEKQIAQIIEERITEELGKSDELFKKTDTNVRVRGGSIVFRSEVEETGEVISRTTYTQESEKYLVAAETPPPINITDIYGGRNYNKVDGGIVEAGELILDGTSEINAGVIHISNDAIRNGEITNINFYRNPDGTSVGEVVISGSEFRRLYESATGKSLDDADPSEFAGAANPPNEGAYLAIIDDGTMPEHLSEHIYCVALDAEFVTIPLEEGEVTLMTTRQELQTEEFRKRIVRIVEERTETVEERNQVLYETFVGMGMDVDVAVELIDRTKASTNIYDTSIPSFNRPDGELNLNPRIEYGSGGTKFNLVGTGQINLTENTVLRVHGESNSAIPQAERVLGVGVYQKVGGTDEEPFAIGLEGNYFVDVPLGTKRTDVSSSLSINGEKIVSSDFELVDPKTGDAFSIQLVGGKRFVVSRNSYGDVNGAVNLTGTVGYRVWNSENIPNTWGAGLHVSGNLQLVNDSNVRIGINGGAGLTYTPGQNNELQARGYVGVIGSIGKQQLRPGVSDAYRVEDLPTYQKKVNEKLKLIVAQMNPSPEQVIDNADVRVILPNSNERRLHTTGSEISAPIVTEALVQGDPTRKLVMLSLSFKDRNNGQTLQYLTSEVVDADYNLSAQQVGQLREEIQGKLARQAAGLTLEEAISGVLPKGFVKEEKSFEDAFAERYKEELDRAQKSPEIVSMGVPPMLTDLFPKEALLTNSRGEMYVIPVVSYKGEIIGFAKNESVINRNSNKVNPDDVILVGEYREKVQELIKAHFSMVEGGLRTAPGFPTLGTDDGGNSLVGGKEYEPGSRIITPTIQYSEGDLEEGVNIKPFTLDPLREEEKDNLENNYPRNYDEGPGFDDPFRP